MDIGTKKEPGRMLSAEEILAPAGGCTMPDDKPPSDGTLVGGISPMDGATDQ